MFSTDVVKIPKFWSEEYEISWQKEILKICLNIMIINLKLLHSFEIREINAKKIFVFNDTVC